MKNNYLLTLLAFFRSITDIFAIYLVLIKRNMSTNLITKQKKKKPKQRWSPPSTAL